MAGVFSLLRWRNDARVVRQRVRHRQFGTVFAINEDGTLRKKISQQLALGAATQR